MRRWLASLVSFVMFSMVVMVGLIGCGSGGGSSVESNAVSGVAAVGVPIVGSVTLKDSSVPAKEMSATVLPDGSYTIDTTGLTAPFLIKVVGVANNTNWTLYSFATGTGVANTNPITTAALIIASGGVIPSSLYGSPTVATVHLIASKIQATISDIQAKLQPLLVAYNATSNPLTGHYLANHTGLDEVFDMVRFEMPTASTLNVRNKSTGSVLFTCQASDIKNGTLDISKIPPAPIRAVLSPIFTAVPIKKTVNFTADVLRSTNDAVTWSVVEANGGTISSSGTYTAPAVEGTYHVKVVSNQNPTLPATATVKVVSDNVDVAITPATTTLASGTSKWFSATVTGSSNTAVTWKVLEVGGGSITSSGYYTAPGTTGTYHVVATSEADPTKSKMASITVTTPPPQNKFPIGTWVGPNGSSFTITKMGTAGNPTYYSGSITLPSGSGSVTVSGQGAPSDSSVIVLGADLSALAQIMTSSSYTNCTYICGGVSSFDVGRTDINSISCRIIMISTSGVNMDKDAVFTRQ